MFVDDRKAKQRKDKGLPVEGMIVVAGRTDKGVTALNQVCSFCMLAFVFILTIKLFCLIMKCSPFCSKKL